MITLYVPLVESRQSPTQKKVSGTNLCRHDLAESAKSADFWLSGRHVSDMSATFPAKNLCLRYAPAKSGKFVIHNVSFNFATAISKYDTFSIVPYHTYTNREGDKLSPFLHYELVCTKNICYPILLFPPLSHPKLLPL
jgi:hypothetical protein